MVRGSDGTRLAHKPPPVFEEGPMTPRETEAHARILIDDELRQAGWDPSDMSMVQTEAPAVLPERPGPLVDRLRAQPFETHAPAYDLVAAAGDFGPDRLVGKEGDEIGWAPVPSSVRLTRDHFVARVEGRSMEPAIPDGAWCLFRADRGGSRDGKRVLVWHRGCTDPALGGEFSVKRYASRKAADSGSAGAWRHREIRLEPLNPDPEFQPLVFSRKPRAIYASSANSSRFSTWTRPATAPPPAAAGPTTFSTTVAVVRWPSSRPSGTRSTPTWPSSKLSRTRRPSKRRSSSSPTANRSTSGTGRTTTRAR